MIDQKQKIMTNLQIIIDTVLVATMQGNSDVQLRYAKDTWYMISQKTGNHSIKADTYTKRVEAHWEGFKINQNN